MCGEMRNLPIAQTPPRRPFWWRLIYPSARVAGQSSRQSVGRSPRRQATVSRLARRRGRLRQEERSEVRHASGRLPLVGAELGDHLLLQVERGDLVEGEDLALGAGLDVLLLHV